MDLRRHLASIAAASALCLIAAPGCGGGIWNAGDLAQWVRDRAVERGCERESISLDDWYTEAPEGNVWHGTCRRRDTGEPMSFGVNVDRVWKPSSPGS